MTDTAVTTNDENKTETFSREYVEGLRKESAKYRNEKNDAVEAAKAEVTNSFESKVAELESKIAESETGATTARHEVDRIKAALGADIEASKVLSFAELLKGDSPDELTSHAEQLKALFVSNEAPATKSAVTDPSQGNGGKPLPLNGDPLLKAITNVINR